MEDGSSPSDSILQFDTVDHTWNLVGQMEQAREKHAISVVRSEDLNYCQKLETTTTPRTTVSTTTVADDYYGKVF